MYSTIDVPILHKDWDGEYSLSSIFLNPKLMGVNISYISYLRLYFGKLISYLDLRRTHSRACGRKAIHEG